MFRKRNWWLGATALAALIPILAARFFAGARDEEAVYEAALQSIFGGAPASGSKASDKHAVFISIGGRDPSAQLLQRFTAGAPTVLPASRGISNNVGDPWRRAFSDPQTRRQGPLFQIHRVQWHGINGASVQIDMPGSGTTYTLQRKSSQWVVTRRDMAWIN